MLPIHDRTSAGERPAGNNSKGPTFQSLQDADASAPLVPGERPSPRLNLPRHAMKRRPFSSFPICRVARFEFTPGQAGGQKFLGVINYTPESCPTPSGIGLGLALLNLPQMLAAAEFRKILDHRGAYWMRMAGRPNYPLSNLGLARAEATSGDTAKARKAYQDLFALWKDADSDLAPLIQARKEYAALP
jgi:hypothetical protein